MPLPYWTILQLVLSAAAAPFTRIWLRWLEFTTDGRICVMKSQASGEFRWIIDPLKGVPVPVIRNSERPVIVTVVLASVA